MLRWRWLHGNGCRCDESKLKNCASVQQKLHFPVVSNAMFLWNCFGNISVRSNGHNSYRTCGWDNVCVLVKNSTSSLSSTLCGKLPTNSCWLSGTMPTLGPIRPSTVALSLGTHLRSLAVVAALVTSLVDWSDRGPPLTTRAVHHCQLPPPHPTPMKTVCQQRYKRNTERERHKNRRGKE